MRQYSFDIRIAPMLAASKFRWTLFSVLIIPMLVAVFMVACSEPLSGNQRQVTPVLQVRVVAVFPHDAGAFTQGLVVEGSTLYEGTGQNGKSTLRKVELKTGRVLAYQPLHPDYFGEGITILDGQIFQLTWKGRTCVVYDKESMKAIGYFNYKGQGWGLANNGKELLMSDGTSTIRVMDPKNFRELRRFRVKDGRRSIDQLNELEFFEGFLYANVWREDRIAKIDPKTGAVVAWIDCSGIYPANARPDREHVLNGIARDEKSGRIFVTGKNWPRLYEIEILEPEEAKP